jgi:hypothetical protein
MTTVQTGASIAGAELAGHADEGSRPRRRTMLAFVAFAGLGSLAALLALSLRPAAPAESAGNTGIVQGTPAMSAAPSAAAEDKPPPVDLGAPGGATAPAVPEESSAARQLERVTTPLASAEQPKAPAEGRKKGSPAVSGASTSGGKPPARNRPRPQPTSDPGRDLMEP